MPTKNKEKREIKFRAWDKRTRTMHNIAGISWRLITGFGEPEIPALGTIQDVDFAENEKGGWLRPYISVWGDNYEEKIKEAKKKVEAHEDRMKEIILMQYADLKDKNGKEIYEGDILEVEHHGSISHRTVKYKDGRFAPFCSDYEIDCELCGYDGIYPEVCTVAGNIYENPELLNHES